MGSLVRLLYNVTIGDEEVEIWRKDGLDYSKSTTRNLVASTAVEIQGKTGIGPEDVEVDENGNIYAGLDNGDFIRIAKDGSYKVLVNTGGRVLGIDRAPSGEFILADAEKGLLSYDIERNKLKTLLEEVNGMKLVFTDDVDVSSNGIVYFSDAAQRYNVRNYVFDAIEHNNDGRIISYNLKTNQSELLADGLYFANGVALSEGEDFLLFNESWIRRVSKLWLKGERKGQVEVFADNLPGIPDGISRGESGIFWVALAAERSLFLSMFSEAPFVRKMLVSIAPAALFPKHDGWAHVLGFSLEGALRYQFIDPKGTNYSNITSVEEVDDKLYFGSLKNKSVGIYPIQW